MAEPTRGPTLADATNIDDDFQQAMFGGLCRERLSYDPATGIFRWTDKCDRRSSMGKVRPGGIAGTPAARGYLSVTIKGRRVLLHHVAWFFTHGTWPVNEIDHKNLNGTDNSIDNLRAATPSQNLANRRRQKNNTSGIKGVSKHRNKWAANISVNGRSVYLGVYESIEDATAAYRKAAKEIYGEFARLM